MNKHEEALKRILDIDLGIYPKSIHDPKGGGYEERTPYMEGWNAAVMECTKELIVIFKDLEIDTSGWELEGGEE